MDEIVPGAQPKKNDGRPFVIFGTPSLYADTGFAYDGSILQSVALFKDEIDWGCLMVPGDPYLAKVRNTIATRFLKNFPTATHLFFIDSDLGWTPSAVRLFVESDLDVCVGVYPKKSDAVDFPCELELDKVTERVIEHPEKPGWFKARGIPTGFLCIKRHVLVKMAKGRGVYKDLDGQLRYNIFQMGFCADVEEGAKPLFDDETGEQIGAWWGEDYAFAKQWHDLGGSIWVYPNIDFSHCGFKAWKNNFSGSVNAYIAGNAKIRHIGEPKLEAVA